MLKLSEENIELKFEAEQARKDVPRLKVGIKFDGKLFFCAEMFSAFMSAAYIQMHFRLDFFLKANSMNPYLKL